MIVRQKKNNFLLTDKTDSRTWVTNEAALSMASSSAAAPPGIDPYQLFGLSKNFTLEQLRKKYKGIAIQVHPDKTGGSDYLFKQCYTAYKHLLKEYEKRDADRPFYELRNQSRSFIDTQGRDNPSSRSRSRAGAAGSHAEAASGKFDAARFNAIFDEHRLEDPTADHGYGHWMASSSKTREDIDIRNTMGKFDSGNFNRMFDRAVPVSKKQSQALAARFKEPTSALALGGRSAPQFTELGVSKVDDFGDQLTNKGISYADYKRAHTTERLVDPALLAAAEQRSQRINLPTAMKQMEAKRENMSYMMSERDRRVYERQKILQQREEAKRQENLKRRDTLIEHTFERLSRLMIGGRR